jgi:hypothetical protein
MTPIRHHNAASLRALIGMLLIGIVARAGLPYLPVVGPPETRVAVKKTNDVSVIALEKSRAKNFSNTVAAVAMPLPAPTKSADTNAETNAPAVTMLAMPESAVDPTFGPTVFNLSEQGLVNITPQMLATYFRPVNVGTNSGVIGGALPIGFVPPFTVSGSHPDSRAEYIVK